jgi:hypothetical protein
MVGLDHFEFERCIRFAHIAGEYSQCIYRQKRGPKWEGTNHDYQIRVQVWVVSSFACTRHPQLQPDYQWFAQLNAVPWAVTAIKAHAGARSEGHAMYVDRLLELWPIACQESLRHWIHVTGGLQLSPQQIIRRHCRQIWCTTASNKYECCIVFWTSGAHIR